MTNVNQLILDCTAKVLRINETTNAEIDIGIDGYVGALECSGYKRGYYHSEKEKATDGKIYPKRDFCPLGNATSLLYFNCKDDSSLNEGAEERLRALLESLNNLEKELIENGGAKTDKVEANDDNHK